MTNDEAIRETGLSEGPGARLSVVSTPAVRTPRPVTNLAKVFGQFAEAQHQVIEQVMALEETLDEERQGTSAALAQLPELKERINWLIASFYEQSQHAAGMEERLNRQTQELDAMKTTMQAMSDAQQHWQANMDQLIDSLLRFRSATPGVARTQDGGSTDLQACAG